MLRKFFIAAGLFLAVSANAVEVDFGELIEVELTVSTVTMNDNGMVVTYEGEAGKYGMVFATGFYFLQHLDDL